MLSLAVCRVNDDVVIELSVDNISRAGNQRQVGEAVEGWLWFCAVNRSGTENLCEHRRVGRLLEGVELNLVNIEGKSQCLKWYSG